MIRWGSETSDEGDFEKSQRKYREKDWGDEEGQW